MNKREHYPTIGENVRYIRVSETGEIFDGEGVAKAIFLDPRNRMMVSVYDKSVDKTYNVDFVGINCSDELRSEYEKVVADVVKLGNEGRKVTDELVKKTVDEYNNKIDELYNPVLGAPIYIEKAENEETGAAEGQKA